MKIAKYVHSCITVAEKGKTFLIDPGIYSYHEKAFELQKLDYILITHEHQDHMHLPWVKELVDKFPNAKVMSNTSVAQVLSRERIKVETKGDDMVEIEAVPHEKIIGDPTPENVMFTIAGKLTHPGDSHSFNKTAEVLALPLQAPWGSFVAAVELAEKLKPKTVIPIHDWHTKDEARKWLYERAADYLGKKGIKVKGLEKGEEAEV